MLFIKKNVSEWDSDKNYFDNKYMIEQGININTVKKNIYIHILSLYSYIRMAYNY